MKKNQGIETNENPGYRSAGMTVSCIFHDFHDPPLGPLGPSWLRWVVGVPLLAPSWLILDFLRLSPFSFFVVSWGRSAKIRAPQWKPPSVGDDPLPAKASGLHVHPATPPSQLRRERFHLPQRCPDAASICSSWRGHQSPRGNGVHLNVVCCAIVEDNAILGAREPLRVIGIKLQFPGFVPDIFRICFSFCFFVFWGVSSLMHELSLIHI